MEMNVEFSPKTLEPIKMANAPIVAFANLIIIDVSASGANPVSKYSSVPLNVHTPFAQVGAYEKVRSLALPDKSVYDAV